MLFVCQTGLLFWFLFLFNFVNVRVYVIEQVPGLKLNKNEQIAMLNLPVVHEGLQRNVYRGKLEGTIDYLLASLLGIFFTTLRRLVVSLYPEA